MNKTFSYEIASYGKSSISVFQKIFTIIDVTFSFGVRPSTRL